MKNAARVFSALQRSEQAAWHLETLSPAFHWASRARVACSAPAVRGFCHIPLPPNPAPSSSGGAFTMSREAELDEAACFGSTFRKNPAEWSVNVKSFLLGSQLDLAKLKPTFRDVLRAEGKVSRFTFNTRSCVIRSHIRCQLHLLDVYYSCFANPPASLMLTLALCVTCTVDGARDISIDLCS